MAWNDIPAKDDAYLRIQAYYARLNIIQQTLSPLSLKIFDTAWKSLKSGESREMRRSRFLGEITSDLVRASALDEAAEVVPNIGAWFVHSGVTSYRRLSDGTQRATIDLPGGVTLSGLTRPECCITKTAITNMSEDDDVSFVVGRRTSTSKFDLVVAGYRDPFVRLQLGGRTLEVSPRSLACILDQKWQPSLLPDLLPRVVYADVPDAAVLAHAVEDTAEHFITEVEDGGAWKMLYDNGEPAHEIRHRALFSVFAKLAFTGLGISIHPSADHGSGSTDLTLSLGQARHVVEFKKDSAPNKILHGLTVQLPAYLRSAGAEFGTYIVMCHARDPHDVREIMASVDDPSIFVHVVDCRPRRSASKA